MKERQFIEKAIEGGWKSESFTEITLEDFAFTPHILLDPKAWEAVGKVEGWEDWKSESSFDAGLSWQWKMEKMTGALIEGKTIEEYIETL